MRLPRREGFQSQREWRFRPIPEGKCHSESRRARDGFCSLCGVMSRVLKMSMGQPLEAEDEFSEEITSRETEVLRMLAEGLVNRDIGVRLGISEHTVKFHISSILDKLGASTRTEAVTLGIRRGLIPI
jgi:DNA-binding NarL/FixJ family response regulator